MYDTELLSNTHTVCILYPTVEQMQKVNSIHEGGIHYINAYIVGHCVWPWCYFQHAIDCKEDLKKLLHYISVASNEGLSH